MSDEIIFTLFYLLLCFCIVYPPLEFVTAGITIEKVFSGYLGSEDELFLNYHLKRSLINLLVYSSLPFGYPLLLYTLGYQNLLVSLWSSYFGRVFVSLSGFVLTYAIYQALTWIYDEFDSHPTAIALSKFCAQSGATWKTVASDINTEFRRVEKVCLSTNPLIKVVVTENWIVKLNPLWLNAAHQSDALVQVKTADSHSFSHQITNDTQFLNIEVASTRLQVPPFTIRIGATDFKDLQDRLTRDITILPNVKFHKSVIEQFVEAFKKTIADNPRFETEEVLDKCIGCMQMRVNVKLQKLCGDETSTSDSCRHCYCKPMWCVDCMAKWFASRQDSEHQTTWLSSKCTCPMCRSKFCILDVSLIENNNESEESGDSGSES